MPRFLSLPSESRPTALLETHAISIEFRRGNPYKEIMWQLFKEFLLFLRQEKKWWLIPLVVMLLILAALIVFSGGSVLAPLMYPFM